MRKEDLVGVWRERGREIVNADGSIAAAIPRNSQIMYSPDGFMSVVSTPKQQEPVPETVARMDLDATTPEARASAAAGVTAYAGTFQVVGEDVHHTLFTALNPNRVGDTQIRHVTLAGDDLTLTAPNDAEGNSFCIYWRRVGSA
jgi:Lipocalin-like domain